RVDWAVALSLTQKGLVGSAVRPHAFTRIGSARVPPTPVSVTRSVRLYCASALVARNSVSAGAANRFSGVVITIFLPLQNVVEVPCDYVYFPALSDAGRSFRSGATAAVFGPRSFS